MCLLDCVGHDVEVLRFGISGTIESKLKLLDEEDSSPSKKAFLTKMRQAVADVMDGDHDGIVDKEEFMSYSGEMLKFVLRLLQELE